MLVYLDCDPGIDDALAIGYLLAHPEVDLALVGSVSGNTDAVTAAANARDLLGLLGRPEIPVAVGSTDFLTHPYGGGAPHVHGDNGIGGVELPRSSSSFAAGTAAQELVQLAHARPGELHVLAIGPLTNLALALQLDPGLPELVADVVIMGGAALAPGNVTAAAEANIHNDPEAAAAVFAANWDVTIVPLDATMLQRFEQGDLDALLAGGPRAAALGGMLGTYFGFYHVHFGRPSSALHDPLAAAVLTREAVVSRQARVPVAVDTGDGPGRGQTIADLRGQYRLVEPQHPDGVRVVFDVAEPFAPQLLARLLALDSVPTGSKP
ncbi:MAG: nucleoside hydrolase [Pseudolysinimonas sp.]